MRRLTLGGKAILVAVVVVVAGFAVAGSFISEGSLSHTRLLAALSSPFGPFRDFVEASLRSPGAGFVAVFLAGVLAGWALAQRWVGSHMRRRSLLLSDVRSPDMPFLDGVVYVREHAATIVTDDHEAAGLIVAEASRGHLGLWRPASATMLRRMSRRQLHTAIAAFSTRVTSDGRRADILGDLMLVRAEVASLWPPRHRVGSIVIDVDRQTIVPPDCDNS